MNQFFSDIKEAFDIFRKNILKSGFYGFIVTITSIFYPIIHPLVSRWFYEELKFDLKDKMSYKFAFLSELLLIVVMILVDLLYAFYYVESEMFYNDFSYYSSIFISIIGYIIGGILFLYPIYGNITGKIRGIKIDIKKSSVLLSYFIIFEIIFIIISEILAYTFFDNMFITSFQYQNIIYNLYFLDIWNIIIYILMVLILRSFFTAYLDILMGIKVLKL